MSLVLVYRIRASAAILATTAYQERAVEGVAFGRVSQLVRDPPDHVVHDDHLFVEPVDLKSLGPDDAIVDWEHLVAVANGTDAPKAKETPRAEPKGKAPAKAAKAKTTTPQSRATKGRNPAKRKKIKGVATTEGTVQAKAD